MTVADREAPGWRERVFGILTDDWGFYYDSVRNLEGAGQQARAMLTGSSGDGVIQKAEKGAAGFRTDL